MVTVDHDYHGLKNIVVIAMNRLTSMEDTGWLFFSEEKYYMHTKRDKIQEWRPFPVDEDEYVINHSSTHLYGEKRRKTQTFLEGADTWTLSGTSLHWIPVIADYLNEKKD